MRLSKMTARLRLAAIALVGVAVAASCATPPVEHADLVLRNGTIVTVDDLIPEVDALAVRGDRIVAVGRAAELDRYIGDETQVIDLDGRLAIPGFIEGHGHFLGIGDATLQLDLRGATSWADVVALVEDAAARARPGELIRGRGWHQDKWDPPPSPSVEGLPLHDALSAVSPVNPVLLRHASGHATLANQKAMELAGITADTPDPSGGEIVRDAARFLEDGEKMQLSYAVQNTHRTVGTRVSSHIIRNFGMNNQLQPDHLTVKLTGSAGQSLGAFAAPGLKLEVSGDANDYVGKGLSGGTIVVRPSMASTIVASDNTIIGNTVLYGATKGFLFAAGRAGERFGVRNSGAHVVIEGCGSNGCEYMTGGVAVILGEIGANFGAGMTGGMAYLYNPDGKADKMLNRETLVTCPVTVEHWENQLKGLIERHLQETNSRKAEDILQHWDIEKDSFLQICPKEMLVHLPAPLSVEEHAIPAE